MAKSDLSLYEILYQNMAFDLNHTAYEYFSLNIWVPFGVWVYLYNLCHKVKGFFYLLDCTTVIDKLQKVQTLTAYTSIAWLVEKPMGCTPYISILEDHENIELRLNLILKLLFYKHWIFYDPHTYL